MKTFIIKIASRCNLNCDYCFVYNKADSHWQDQPKVISTEIFQISVEAIRGYALRHELKKVHIIFHGGEPLLAGLNRIEFYLKTIRDCFNTTSIVVRIGMQSNGLLFNSDLGLLLREYKATIGISVDGPPIYQDKHRKDHRNKGSGVQLEEKLQLIATEFRDVLSGFLVVIDLENDPITILEYLVAFKPRMIDFLLPYDNWDNRPPRKEQFESTFYADWLLKLFGHWFTKKGYPPIRLFDSIIRVNLGGNSLVESVGLDPVDLIVIETNGDLEAVDSLKASYNGATMLGLNIKTHTLDDASNHYAVLARQLGVNSLCEKCKSCDVVHTCGGGYIPNRYSSKNGFINPSIYCYDLQKLIRTIQSILKKEFEQIKHNVF